MSEHRRVEAFAPGRIEIAGNHTDHQGGRTVSATVDRGIRFAIRPRKDGAAHIESPGFAPVDIRIDQHDPVTDEMHTTAGLARGVVAGLAGAGVDVRGFDARIESRLAPGGGLSSSAAFSVGLAKGLDALFGSDALSPLDLARIAQEAEQGWFGKPCGLQDQLVIACGGVLELDFNNPAAPDVRPLPADFADMGLSVCLIDTHIDHSAATDEFAQIVGDMQAVAALFGKERLGEVDAQAIEGGLPRIRSSVGDRAALRAIHYVCESRLTAQRAQALAAGDARGFLAATRQSAASSAHLLRNLDSAASSLRPVSRTLTLAHAALAGRGACRIHGGGFGGTCIAFVPTDSASDFIEAMDSLLGPSSCFEVHVGSEGARATCW